MQCVLRGYRSEWHMFSVKNVMPPDFVKAPRKRPSQCPVYILTFKIKYSKNTDASAHFILTIIRRIQGCCSAGLHPPNVLLHSWLFSVCSASRIECDFNGLFEPVSRSESTDGRTRDQCQCVELSFVVVHFGTHNTTFVSPRFGLNVSF